MHKAVFQLCANILMNPRFDTQTPIHMDINMKKIFTLLALSLFTTSLFANPYPGNPSIPPANFNNQNLPNYNWNNGGNNWSMPSMNWGNNRSGSSWNMPNFNWGSNNGYGTGNNWNMPGMNWGNNNGGSNWNMPKFNWNNNSRPYGYNQYGYQNRFAYPRPNAQAPNLKGAIPQPPQPPQIVAPKRPANPAIQAPAMKTQTPAAPDVKAAPQTNKFPSPADVKGVMLAPENKAAMETPKSK